MATKRKAPIGQKFDEDANKEKTDFFNDFSDGNAAEALPETSIPKNAQDEKKTSTVMQRIKTGFSIFGSFLVLILMGPFYCCLLVLVIEIGFFREIINLKRNYMRETMIKSSTFLVWFIFISGTINFFIWNFSDLLMIYPNNTVKFVTKYRNFLFFGFYLIGFLLYVMTLKFGYIRYQVRLFIETHIALLVIAVVGCSMIVIYEGLIWFLLGALAVILNDCCAYIAGMKFGKTRLIDLSPKKTVEGFIGGIIGTVIVMRVVR